MFAGPARPNFMQRIPKPSAGGRLPLKPCNERAGAPQPGAPPNLSGFVFVPPTWRFQSNSTQLLFPRLRTCMVDDLFTFLVNMLHAPNEAVYLESVKRRCPCCQHHFVPRKSIEN